jgi:hypothetical protein
MKNQQIITRLEQMVSGDLEEICKNLIIKSGDGYEVFGRYQLQKTKDGVAVKHINGIHTLLFGNMKTGLSWCIADKFNQHTLAMKLEKLDSKHQNLRCDVLVRQQIINSMTDFDRKEVAETKISTKKIRLKQIDNELDKCVNLAKYWQRRGLNDEIARTRRQATNRTNRQGIRVTSR